MKKIKVIVIMLILFAICVSAPAANWDIGAVQKESSATDIGAVQESVAVGATGSQVIIINMN